MRPVHLDVASTPVRFALTYVLEQAGYRRTHDPAEAELRIADRHGLRGAQRVTTLVVDLVPAECQFALDAITAGRALTAISADDPESLIPALRAAADRTVHLPSDLVDEANRAPRLEHRLRQTLRLVIAGHSNPAIARQLHESESTAKRDIGVLLRRFDVPNRVALVAQARMAGFDA